MTGWDSSTGSVAAAGWEANAERTEERLRPVTDWLIERCGLRAGDIALDLAAGPGGVGHRAASLVGAEGRVLSTDIAPAMVETAQRMGAQRGLTNVEYRVMDAQAMDLDDDTVNAVLCRSGFMLMPRPVDALRETRRVLRANGNLTFSVFGLPERNPFVAVPQRVFIELGHLSPPPPDAPGVFALSDASRIRAALMDADFELEAMDAIDLEGSFPNGGFIVDRILEMNVRVGPTYRGLSESGQATAREAMLDEFEAFRRADGTYSLPSQMWGVHAR